MAEQLSKHEVLSSEIAILEVEKRRLECEKLRAEIAETSLSWWKRAGYIGSATPILIALVGLLSAWATGFFDAQRATLKSEIESLKQQEKKLQNRNNELASANAGIQEKIDRAYISLKLASADASYALGHMRGMGPSISDDDRKKIETTFETIPVDVSELVRRLIAKNELAEIIVPITEKELEGFSNRLRAIPASEWAVELQPIGGPVPALRASDGRIYNPADGKFYDKLEDLDGH